MLSEKALTAVKQANCTVRRAFGVNAQGMLIFEIPKYGFKKYMHSPYGVFDDLEFLNQLAKIWSSFDAKKYAAENCKINNFSALHEKYIEGLYIKSTIRDIMTMI